MQWLWALFLLAGTLHAGSSAERGVYFSKKTYVPEALPVFAQAKQELPGPVWEGREDLLALYWEAWRLGYSHLHRPGPRSPLVSNYMDAAFSKHLFQWDTIFMVPFAAYGHHVFPMVQSLDNFYARQRADGYISRELVAATGADYVYRSPRNTVNPPLFAWAEVQNARLTGDTSRYPLVYDALAKHAEWLERGRRVPGTRHGLYWNTPLGSGMDNTPRSGSGWVDMSSQMVMLYRSLAEIAQALGKIHEAREHAARAEDVTARIQAFMWDERDGLFYDVDDLGRRRPRKTIACFWPMLARVATPVQVSRMITHLRDPRTFWRPNVWPSLAADDPRYSSVGHYWRGGVWAPTNAMVVNGLKAYPEVPGALELAREGAARYLENVLKSYRRTGTIWEFYRPESARPGVLWWFLKARPNFVGWSGIGPIQFLLEDLLGFKVEALEGKVTWRPRELARHGVRQLRVGSRQVSLLASSRPDACSPLVIEAVLVGGELTLDIPGRGTRRLVEGAQRLEFASPCAATVPGK